MVDEREYRFGAFVFDAGTGELRSTASGTTHRLPPQPARLLAMLLERRGELVTRETIRDELWGGVEVDFDRGLHFCVRQIRSALGDSATEQRYVETLPRRGYRFRVDGASPPPPTAARLPGRRLWGLATIVVAAVALAATAQWACDGTASVARPLRVGIMPFVPTDPAALPGSGVIAERLLERLTPHLDGRAEVVEPTTTSTWQPPLRDAALAHQIDYLINGRFVLDAPEPRLLGELIRVTDGAHVWVASYPIDVAEGRFANRSPHDVADAIGEGILERLPLERLSDDER